MKTRKEAEKVRTQLLKELGPGWKASDTRPEILCPEYWTFYLVYGPLLIVHVLGGMNGIGVHFQAKLVNPIPTDTNPDRWEESGSDIRQVIRKCFENSQEEIKDLEAKLDNFKNVQSSVLANL